MGFSESYELAGVPKASEEEVGTTGERMFLLCSTGWQSSEVDNLVL